MDAIETILRALTVLGLFAAAVWWVRNRAGLTGPAGPRPTVRSRTPLTRRTSLVVVDLDGRRLVLGTADAGSVTVLADYASPADDVAVDEPASSAAAGRAVGRLGGVRQTILTGLGRTAAADQTFADALAAAHRDQDAT